MLTDNRVKNLKAKPAAYYEWEDTGQRGVGRLGVKVEPTGSKTFYFRYYDADKVRRFVVLGKFPEVSLAQARDAAREFGGQVSSGQDPKKLMVAAAEADAALGTIKQLFELYTERMRIDGKRTYKTVFRELEKETYHFIAPTTKAKNVKSLHIKNILAAMIQRGAAVQSNRIRSYLHAAWQYGLRADNDPAVAAGSQISFGLEGNPVTAVPRQNVEKTGENWLKISEVRYLLESFSTANKVGFQSAQLLLLCFHLGGQRPYEIISSKWQDIDFVEKTWTIRKDVSKTSRPHMIPLTSSAIDVINAVKARNFSESDFIFPNHDDKSRCYKTDSFGQAIRYYLFAEPDFKKFIPRDIRRTCKTLMGEIGISKQIRDILMNHARHDVSSRHYDRYEYVKEKRAALELWEQYLNGVT